MSQSESGRIQLRSFRLKGLPFFRDSAFDLSYKGVSLILGKNFDASKEATNGAGKSMFFSELTEMLTPEPMIGTRGDVIRKGVREFNIRKRGHDYKIVREFSPREKITIFKDGVDLEYRELAVARAALFKLLPYTPQEVRSLFYIDSRNPHPLIRGNAAERREFFRRFFHMDAAPTMRKVVKAELDAVNIAGGGLVELNNRLSQLRLQSKDKKPEAIKASIRVQKNAVSELSERTNAYMEARRVYTSYQEHKPRIKMLKAFGITDAETLASSVREIEAKLETIAVLLDKWDSYDEAKSERAQYKKDKAKLTVSIKEAYLSDPQSSLSKLKLRRKNWRASITVLESQRDEEIEKMKKYTKDKCDRVQAELKELDREFLKLQKNKGKCPTCGGKFDDGHSDARIKELKEEILEKQDFMELAPKKFDAFLKATAEITLDQEELEKKLETATAQITLLEQFLDLKAVPNMEPPSERTRETLEKERKELLIEKKLYHGAEACFDALDKYTDLSENDRELAKGEDPTDALMEANQNLGKLKGELSEAESLIAELEQLKTRKAEMETLLSEKPVLELLLQGLSKGGVESQMMQGICLRLEQLVNRYSKMIFQEDYTFKFELEPNFSFLVTRRYGKRLETSDVRKLSGAESLLFALVLYVALMFFKPESRRTNLLMLDEPTANFGPEMTEAFIRFLPTLNSIVDHIIVITPMPQQPYPGAKIWTVVKKDGISQIMEGQKITLESVNASRSNWNTAAKPARPKTRRASA